jgi:hypothetical protein
LQNSIKNDLQNVFSGKSKVRFGAITQSIANYLRIGAPASPEIADTKRFKKQETEKLELFISENNLWRKVDFSHYVSEGAEQKVYLKDSDHVLKLNDTIYCKSWRDYLLNLLLHNYFFPDTAYNLLGFTKQDEILYAVVEQSFFPITESFHSSVFGFRSLSPNFLCKSSHQDSGIQVYLCYSLYSIYAEIFYNLV